MYGGRRRINPVRRSKCTGDPVEKRGRSSIKPGPLCHVRQEALNSLRIPRRACHDSAMSRESVTRSFGAALQLGCLIVLLALIPYALYSGLRLYAAASTWAGGEAGPLAYAIARVVACVILIYALWQLRKTGLRLRNDSLAGR